MVYAIGSPEGLELTLSEGLISGLFDGQGHLIGITAFYIKEGQNLNFALPWLANC